MYGLKEGEAYKPWLWPVPAGGVIGKRDLGRRDGYDKASGKGTYSRDVYRPGMLYAKFLLSPYAHAKIKKMDNSKAAALPGVRAILRYDDPQIDWNIPTGLTWIPHSGVGPENILPGTADWYPQPMGAIVCADSEAIVDQALKLIEIEWEELPFVLDPEEALKPGAPILRPDLNPKDNQNIDEVTKYGDIEKGFAEADKIIEFTARSEDVVWAGVEGQCCVAEWHGDYLDVWYHGQCPGPCHESLTRYTPWNKIHVHTPYNGALMGGISWLAYPEMFSHFAVLLSKRTDRPVKVLYDGSHFHGAEEQAGVYKYKVGFKNDGRITAVKMDSVWCRTTFAKISGATGIPNLYRHEVRPFLSKGPIICFKDGAPECMTVTHVIDHVAGELKMDPTKVRLINDGCEGHDMAWVDENVKKVQGFDPTRDSLKECLEVGKKAIDWDNKWHVPGTKILPNGKYHGMGFTAVNQWGWSVGQCSAGIKVRGDGTVLILGRHSEGGWGGWTPYCQVVADEMGMKFEDVVFKPFDDPGFEFGAGGGSVGLSYTTPALIRAARKAKQNILEYASKPGPYGEKPPFPNMTPDKLDIWNSEIFEIAKPANKVPVARVMAPYCGWCGDPAPIFAWDFPPLPIEKTYLMVRHSFFMEVEVDPDTGDVEVTKMACVNDVGKAIDPNSCNGQQYGGAYMGIGRTFTESVQFDPPTGVKLNDNLIGYAIAVMNDCGPIDCKLVETGLAYAPYGHTGMGEDPGATVSVMGGTAIYNAIGKWIDDYPITPNKVLKALGKA